MNKMTRNIKRILLLIILLVIIYIFMYNNSCIKNYFLHYLYRMEKLTITLSYDENEGLPVSELSNYLLGLNNAYYDYSKNIYTLSIKSIDKGSIIISFTKKVILPLLANLVSDSLYDFGKDLFTAAINVVNDKQIVEKINKGDPESLKKARSALTVVGSKNIININNIYVYGSNGKEQYEEVITKESIDKLNTVAEALNKRDNLVTEASKKVKLYESLVIQFEAISRSDGESKIYRGKIASIDKNVKKVIFQGEVKNSFNFDKFDFNTCYLVSVKVYYNPDNSVSKYCIIENLGVYNE